MSAFNIRPDFSYSRLSLCVKFNMSSFDIYIFQLVYLLSTISLILLLYIISALANMWIRKKSEINDSETLYKIIDQDSPYYSYCPLQVRLKCAYLQLLLFGYSSIALFSFTAVHCVKINDSDISYLYVQASIPCYQIWQKILLSFICCWVILFPLVSHCATKSLRHCKMSPSAFMLVITCPPTYLYFMIKSNTFAKQNVEMMRQKDAMLAKHFLAVIEEPFKQSTKLCWESVLIFRRTILIAIHTFIICPLNRIYPNALMLTFFLLHHCYERPFTDELSNTIEFVSFTLLSTLNITNTFWAFSAEYTSLIESENYRNVGKVLLLYECFMLLLPFIMILVYAVVELAKWMFGRCKQRLRKKQQ